MDRDVGKGPFKADNETWSARELENGEMLAVLDGRGEMFCYVQLNDCAGMDKSAAKARATRIAEALNTIGDGTGPRAWIDEHGALRAPEGHCFEVVDAPGVDSSGNQRKAVKLVPLVNLKAG